MTAKLGRPCLLTLFLVAAVIAGAGVRSQEPTQEAKSQKPEQENAAPPTGKTRPTIKGNSQGWLPIHMVADKDSDRAAIVADLNAAGFDAIDQKFYSDNRGYILAAPRPTGTWDESLALAKEILHKNSGTLMDSPPPDYSTAPHSFTSVKWKPKQADAETRERELLKVVDALADSDLPLRHIHYDLRRDGSNYLWLIYSSSAADDVEAFVRRVVEEPAIWPPNSILLPGDKSPALHALQPPTNEPASRPRGMSISGIPVRLGSEVTIGLPSEGDRSTIRRTLESEGYDILDVDEDADEDSTWTIYLPSEADIEASVARVREVVGPTVKVTNPDAFDMPVANIERALSRPVSLWFFTWTPENQDRAKQEAERGQVEDAFLKSGLGVEQIHWRSGRTDRIRAFVASPPDKIPQIEELVRTLVKEPKFWRPPQWDKYLADRKMREPAQAASRPTPVAATKDSPGGLPVVPSAAMTDPDATPATSKRPLVRKGDGWHPLMIVPANDADFDEVIVKLNAAGFDAIKVPGSNWIPTAPRPNQTEAESVPQIRALLGEGTYINPPGDGPRKTSSPDSFTCVKWTPKESGDEAQEADLNRVVTALADSGLPFEVIDHDQRRDGSNYIFAIHSADSDSEVEALIRQLVEEPALLWPSQSITVNRKTTDEGTPAADPQPIDGSLNPLESDPAATPPVVTPPVVPTLDPPPATVPAAPPDPAAVSPDPMVPGTISPPAIAPAEAPAITRQRPKIEPMGAPSHFKVELHPAFEGGSIKTTLEAEGFDIRGSVDSEGWSRWYVTAPSEADLEQSERQLREALGPEAKITAYLRNLPRELVERMLTSPTRQWFFKWTSSDAPGRWDEEQLRVAEGLADSTLDIRKITYSDHGASYITIQSPPAEIPKIEEFVRTLVKEPRFWRPVRLENYYAQHASNDPSQEAAEAPAAGFDPLSPVDPAAVVEEPAKKSSDPPATPAETPQSPPFAAKVLLIEADWEEANDRQAASRLAQSILNSNASVEMNRAGAEVFRPGYAATFQRDEARTVSEDMQRLGLVRQSLAMSAVDLGLSEEGVEALGAVQLSFGERSTDGTSETVVWNVLIVTETTPNHSAPVDPFAPTAPVPARRVAVVAWKDRVTNLRAKESERYVGSFLLRADQSAIVPLTIPGVEGAAIVVSRAQKGPAVRSLGPLSGNATQQPMTADASIDWNDLIRAYEDSPLGVAGTHARTVEMIQDASEVSESGEAEVTFHWRPAEESQVDPLLNAVTKRSPQAKLVLRQFQGDAGATLVFRTPETSAEALAEAIEAVATPIVPVGATMQTTISKVPSEPPADGSQTVVLHLQYASAVETAKLLDSLKLDPAIRLASDARTNSIILSAPPATKYAHVQATIALVEKLDQPVQARPDAENAAAKALPDRAAEIARLRSDVAREEADVQKAAEAARSASERDRPSSVDSLRQVVVRAFDRRLKLQREEAAELRDRLAKIEENLSRRERIAAAVIERRIEVLLDPALEWPEVALEQPSSLPVGDSDNKSLNAGPEIHGRGDAFSAATSLALQIVDLTDEANAIVRAGSGDGFEVRMVLISRQLELLRQEFDARQQALKLELEALKANLSGAQASYERVRAMFDTGAIAQEEVAKVEAELNSAKSDVARQEVLLQQYDRARASLPSEGGDSAETQSAALKSADLHVLKGTWRVIRAASGMNPTALREETRWRFIDGKLIVGRILGATPQPQVEYSIEPSLEEPDLFIKILDKPDGTATRIPVRFEIRGATLHVVVPQAVGGVLPDRAVPNPGDTYYEFERIKDWAYLKPSTTAFPSMPTPAASGSVGDAGAGSSAVPASSGESDEGSPKELQGTWRLVRQTLGNDPLAILAETTWTFDGDSLTETKRPKDKPPISFEMSIEHSAEVPGAFTRVELSGPWKGARRLSRYKVEGTKLHVTMRDSPEAKTFPEEAAPGRGDIYFEFERVADIRVPTDSAATGGREEASDPASVPSELLGTWRMTKHEVQGNPESNVAPTTWDLEGSNLTVKRKGLEDVDYVLEFPQDSPDEFRSFRVATIPQGREIVERGFRYRYEIVEDSLRVIQGAGDGRSLPESVAPAPGVVYYEFERVSDTTEADPAATPTTDESVQGPEFLKQVHEFAAALRAKEQAIRETKGQLASIRPADATADGVKKTIETYENEAERHRDTIRGFQFYAERACESVQAKADAATDEDEKRKLSEQVDRFAAIVLSIREVAESAGVTIEEGWKPQTGAESRPQTPNYSVEELRSEFEATKAKLKSLDPSDGARRQAQDRLGWLQRTAKSQWESLRSSENGAEGIQWYLRRYQDDYFVKEKALADAWKRGAAPDELDQATFQFAVQLSVLARTRELAEQTASEKAELDELLTEMSGERDDAGSSEAAPPGSFSPPGAPPSGGDSLRR